MSGSLEERLARIEQENDQILNDINALRNVEAKLDKLNDIALEIRRNSATVIKRAQDQERALEEMRVGADFRRRESENSVREIKNQMSDMSLQNESSVKHMLDTIISSMKESEAAQKEYTKELKRQFDERLNRVEERISSYVRVTWFGLTLSIIAILTVLSLLYFVI